MDLPQADGAYRNDINVTEVWNDYTGKGVVVGVLDGGFEIDHPDLAPNALADKFYDTLTSERGNRNDDHGTATMGLILAAQNGQGVVGVAFGSKGIGYSGIDGPGLRPFSPDPYLEAVQYMLMDGVSVVNNSWGDSSSRAEPMEYTRAQSYHTPAHLKLVQQGRAGLGIVNLFAAGNDREAGDNTLFSPQANSPYVITVAAANADGTVTSYSTAGPNVLVAAPGSGANSFGGATQVPSIVTTDLLGTAGSNKSKDGDYTNLLDNQYDPPDSTDPRDYDPSKSSGGFNGTSAAAPIASGVVALMLEANPLLGYRDVQEILAYSARTPDGVATWKTNGATDWNGGGHRFNDDLGFGLVDARAAVRLAETWTKQSTYDTLEQTTVLWKGPSDDVIVVGPGGSLSLTTSLRDASFLEPMRVQHTVVTVEMEMSASADGLTPASDIAGVGLTLTGPDGRTVTKLLDPASYSPQARLPTKLSYSFDTVQHWGVMADAGTWTLDVSNGDKTSALTLKASLTLMGDTAEAGQTFIYTDDYGHLADGDPSRAVLSATTTGPHTLNAAAVSGNTVIDLAQHSAAIAGVATRIGDSMQFDSIITGDGDDQLSGASGADVMRAGRGDDVLWGGGGADILFGGRGADILLGQDGSDMLLGEDGNDRLAGGDGADTLIGGLGDDELGGDLDDDVLVGDDGRDTLFGGLGDDRLNGGNDADVILGNEGNDQLGGGFGNDMLAGGDNADTLWGEEGNDTLDGGTGDDILIGGSGADQYNFGANSGADIIVGFDAAEGDRLALYGQSYVLGQDQYGNALLSLSGGGSVALSAISPGQVNAGFLA